MKQEKAHYETCIGHISPQNPRCQTCTEDQYNHFCEDYKPVRIWSAPYHKKMQEERRLKNGSV